MVTITLKVDNETAALLETMARQRGLSRAGLVREGIQLVLQGATGQPTALERFGAAVGCIDEGPGDLAENTGARFGASLANGATARR